ncbi:MAG: hypothetical protein Q9227_002553 [Pyrenula ochraceoflavens]
MDTSLKRDDSRLVIHFDYDCFYASVVEAENPALKSLPLAIQQKQIIVTCNYEARRRDVVIVLGGDLTRFRDASKALYNFLRERIWSDKVERLGFDEVFLDCTDMINYNVGLLNPNDLQNSFFHLDKGDPTVGFRYNATTVKGPTFPVCDSVSGTLLDSGALQQRLTLGSHLAMHLRHEVEQEKGYTATVGISTNKLLSKLVGNVNKPKSQTTLTTPYESFPPHNSNVLAFIDPHDVGKIPGIGFKMSQKVREYVLGRKAEFHEGLVYGKTKEAVTVRDVRISPDMSAQTLEELLGGPNSPKGIGGRVWGLLHGIDDMEVGKAKSVPSQISIEDSYIRLDTIEEVRRELTILSNSLIRRIHMDLLETEIEDGAEPTKRWLAHPRTFRLSTRPRPPLNPDGTRPRSFNRISRSFPMPQFVFSLTENVDALSERLVGEVLIPNFRKLHPERSGWNLSLVNIAVTNMAETAADSKDSQGRDIGKMFQRQDDVLKEWRVHDDSHNTLPPVEENVKSSKENATELKDSKAWEENDHDDATDWQSEDEDLAGSTRCSICGLALPPFAMTAHERFHADPD